ncbi:hypothetical protein MUG84_04975 [Paenibacillus sp. KQZ6P-2]|uniref:Uncharacterized protein n=1 Tax=Paenibacillus mangrovi TaxID=2931978 RepID=A0A9X1WKQ6_9BACL|nr:hypothetical protein [Paenibacillus mangrovi]MCJ8011097.1 hypothetical protein [Paenibacillus mangrovi]
MQITSELQHALQQVSKTLSQAETCWLVGGSCGLLLQNVHLDAMPSDIDVYTDQVHVAELHRLMKSRTIDEPALSETERYHSILSHYKLEGYMMELVGGFKVRSEGGCYEVLVDEQLYPHAAKVNLQGTDLPLMPLGHELVFNVLRERSDRYLAIAQAMRLDLPAHMPLMRQILDSSNFSDKHSRQILSLLELDKAGNKEFSSLQALLGEEPQQK